MYCPRCGQQQASEQTKFCSRCGFQLAIVGEVLLHNGTLPQLAELYSKRSGLFTRRNGVMFSVFWLLFFLFIMTPFWGIVDVEELAAMSAILGIFGGLMFLIGSLVFLKKPSTAPAFMTDLPAHGAPTALYGNPTAQALPPQRSQTVDEYVAPQGSWRTPDTGEFAVPGSVAEGTTKLLKKNE